MKSDIYTLLLAAVIVAAGAFAPADSHAQESWVDRLSFKGDFRPRLEYIDRDEGSFGEAVDERRRSRFRVRFGMTAEVNENVDFVFELATGGENPVSTNQSFDGGFTRKAIGVNLAYANWRVTDSLNVQIGKVKNPLHRAGGHHLVWDSDLNPEGLAIKYAAGGFSGSIGMFGVEERSTTDDTLLLTLQGAYEFNISDESSLTAGIGYHAYSNMIGNSPFWNGVPFGNTVDVEGNFIYDYKMIQGFVEYSMKLGELPLSFFIDYVQNTEAPVFDTGYAFGGKLGKASQPGDWQASIAYQDLEADAVVALYTDSDFGGGGTDGTGFTIKGKYALKKNLALGGTLFVNEIESNINNPTDYTRVQIDIEFKF
jgi:hypothetical protein